MPEVKFRDTLLALLLCAVTAAALGWTQRDLGVMRDEATYFQAGERYWGWFEELGDTITTGKGKPFSNAVIARYWSLNNEHPVLCKILFGVSWRLLHGFDGKHPGFHPNPYPRPQSSLQLMSEISAFRLPGWLFAGLAVALLYLFGARVESRVAGLAAAALYITIPRVFFHGQLACFDSPISTMWLLVVYAYFRSLDSPRWGVLAGVCFGLALATKHNAWFLPPLLVLHYLIVIWPDLSLRPLQLPRIPLVFVAMAVLGPLVFLAHWPWLWFDTWRHLKDYFGFHLHHSYYNIEYLGTNWGLPPHPISYPFGMTLYTVPTVTLLLAAAGLWVYARAPILVAISRVIRRLRPPADDLRFRYGARRSWVRPGQGLDPRLGTLFLLNALFPLALIAMPSTPIFGGTKHWLPAYPFLALLAGVAVSRLVAAVAPRRALLGVGVALLVALPGAVNVALTHPFGLTQYNALAGGAAGGADKGLVRQFWGYATRQLLPWMNQHLPKKSRVYFHDTNYDSYGAYIRDGLLRPDIAYTGIEKPAIEASDHAIVLYELHFNKYDYWIWDAYNTATPVRVLDLDGVPVASLYRRPTKTPAGKP